MNEKTNADLPSLTAAVGALSRAEEAALMGRYRAGDPAALGLLLASYQRYLLQLAMSYRGYGLDDADLVQAGNIGVMEALRRYDPATGLRFLTYAAHWIRQEMNEFVLRNERMVRRYTTPALRKIFFNRSMLRDQANSWRPAAEVAAELEVPVRAVKEVQAHLGGGDDSLDLPEGGFGPAHFLRSPDDPARSVLHADYQARLAEALGAALSQLTEREQDIIRRRQLAEAPDTLQTLGETYGVSAERIRQIEGQALRKLKATLEQAGWGAAA